MGTWDGDRSNGIEERSDVSEYMRSGDCGNRRLDGRSGRSDRNDDKYMQMTMTYELRMSK